MHIIIWEFKVRGEHVADFVAAYNSEGDWAKLFQKAEGYFGTELLRAAEEPNLFLTVDRWQSAGCFEMFRERFGAEYKKLDARLQGYTSNERKLGEFTEA